MNRFLVFVSVVALVALVFGCSKISNRPPKRYTIEQFLNTVAVTGSSFSSDESRVLFSSDKSGVFNAYVVPVTCGEEKQLTHSTENSVFAISFFPDDDRFLYRSDQGGNEIYHIYMMGEDGVSKDLTPYEGARAVFYGWSHDKKSFFFGCNKRNPRFMDLYEMDIETMEPHLVYQNDFGLSFGAISNDRKLIAFSKTITEHNSDIYLYDVESKELKKITPHEGDIRYFPVDFTVDSKKLLYLTDEDSEFTYLKIYDIETEKSDVLEKADWDVSYAYLSYNGRYLVVAVNNDATTEIRIYEMPDKKPVSLPEMPGGVISSVNISRSEKLMAFYVNGSRSPNNLYVYDFDTGKYRKLTESMNPEIDKDDLVEARVVRYRSFDGLEIPAILYEPLGIRKGEKVPALVWVHGGPGGQSRVGYNSLIQYLVNHGYVVLAVNNRGSSGYGKTFYRLDDMKHGEDDLGDCVAAKGFLKSLGYVDEERIGIIGGSYGGYMVLAALTLRPTEFAVGVDLFGISNWIRTLKSIPPWWESFRDALYKEMGDPDKDEEYLRRISPLFNAEKIVRPLMVLQGANDPRVLKVESDEIVNAAKKNGVPVEYLVFEDEGHGFLKKANRIKGYRAIREFLDRYLKGEAEKKAA